MAGGRCERLIFRPAPLRESGGRRVLFAMPDFGAHAALLATHFAAAGAPTSAAHTDSPRPVLPTVLESDANWNYRKPSHDGKSQLGKKTTSASLSQTV